MSSGLTRSGTTATATSSGHGYAVGDDVLVTGADQPEYNGIHRICAYVLMPNHFHLVLWPRADGQLSDFMRWLTMIHTQRWHAHRHTAGHLYQRRFKSFPIEPDDHFLRVCRYVERNPLRANLVPRSADWPWGSLACRTSRPDVAADLLDDWPVDRPANWTRTVDRPQAQPELDALRLSASRDRPYGSDGWTQRTAARLGLESSLRPHGRPRLAAKPS